MKGNEEGSGTGAERASDLDADLNQVKESGKGRRQAERKHF